MAFLFLFMSVLCFIAVVHPFATYPLTLGLVKKRPIKFGTQPAPKTYAICMCAYNEEAVIEEKAQNLLALKQQHPNLAVYIYVDCASDNTAKILEKYSSDFDIHVASRRHGKTYGMNLLVSKAQADIIVFTDANVMLDPSSITALGQYFTDPEVGCVCGHLQYINADEGVTASTGSLYWKIEEMIKQLESDTGSIMGADGSIFAIRRDLHTAPPADIIDDMFVSMSILCDGYRIVRAQDVLAYEKSVTSSKEEFKRKVRISCQSFNVHKLLWTRLKKLNALDLYKYVSHKLLRWFGIAFIVACVFFFLLSLIFAGLNGFAFFLSILMIAFFWVGSWYNVKPVAQILDILSAYTATGLGLWKSMCGERFQTWSPAQSIRGKART